MLWPIPTVGSAGLVSYRPLAPPALGTFVWTRPLLSRPDSAIFGTPVRMWNCVSVLLER